MFPSFSPDVHGDIAKVAVHVFITMIRHHHLIICVLLLPYSSSCPRSSPAAVATLVSYWFSIFVSKVHFFQQEIYACKDLCFKRSSRWGEWSFDALWLLHRWRSQGLFLRLLGSTHPRNRSLPFSLKFLATWQDRLPKIVRKSCSHGATRKVVLFRR